MENIILNEDKYRQLVHNNHHGELLETVAKDLKVNHYARLFQSINTIHSLEGHINYDVLELRTRINNDFKKFLNANLTNEQYSIISKYV